VNVTLKLFAAVRDIVGESSRQLEVDTGSTPAGVWALLTTEYPGLAVHRIPMVAVNQEYAAPNHPLHEGDELAFIPPVSGG
jgi:molybdopterin converting factor subunit 1